MTVTAASEEVGEASAETLRNDGLVVLPERLDADFVAELREAFLPLVERYARDADPNRGVRRHQMYLPFELPFSDARLWGAPGVLDVVERVLGPEFECTYYGSDTPFPGAEHQPVHQDGGPLFPDWEPRPPPYCLALNVMLVDVGEANGPFEWFDGIERPATDAEPNRVTGEAGTMLLRDTRTWHRGSPNEGDAPRPMLALLYTKPWFRFPLDRPVLDRTVLDTLPDPGPRLFRNAEFTTAPSAAGDRPRLAVPS